MKQTFKKRCVFLLFALMSILGYAQTSDGQILVTGTVEDNSGVPLPGVNVTEKSSKNTVVTDFNGKYVIRLKTGATLVFSYIGMKKREVPVGGKTSMNIVLEDDANQLEQVVVVGYGTQKRERLTGAIVTIDPEKIQDLPVSNLAEALRGQIPGLSVGGFGTRRPGESASLEIRQNFSFSKDGGSSIPLIVIDDMVQVDPINGKPTLDAFNRLDPSEIESITVLKDGSAAIYGSRASQGAIVVKTKRGKAGVTKFSYYSQFAINDAVSHAKTTSAYEDGIYNNRIQEAFGDNPATSSKFYSPQELEEMKTLNYDWLKKAWKPAEQQKHSLTVSGGNDKATYFAGVTYFTQGANLGDQDYKKWNFRTGVNAKVTNDLDLSVSVSGNSGDIEKSFTKSSSSIRNGFASASTNAEQADYGFLLHMPRYVPITTMVNGKEYYMSPFHRTDRNLGGNQDTNSSIAGWNYFALQNSGSKQIDSDFSYNVNASLSYKVPFVKGLSLRGAYARSQSSSYTEQVALPFTLARITNFTSAGHHLASEAMDSNYNIKDNTKQSRVVYDNSGSKSVQANFFVNYSRSFGDHDIDAMFSVERSESNFDFVRLYYENPGKDYLGTYATAGTLTTNSYNQKGESGTLSRLGRLNYSYKDRYLVQFIFRQDASTKFAPENYWGSFPGLQLGWIASKEEWFQKALPAVDFLKFRYSIGKTGNDNINPWRWVNYYDVITDKGAQFGSAGGTLGSALAPRVNPNRNVGWDTHIKNNYGIDFNVLNNRLQVSADYYFDRGTKMLVTSAGQVDVPISVGGGYAEENIAAVDSWGTEFSVKWSDRIKENFSYNVGINFGLFAGNEVKAYPDGPLQHPSYNDTRTGSTTITPSWGFKTWNETSTGDGILRTDADVQNYWNYLTANAAASGVAGAVPNFLGQTNISGVKKGMLAYQDIAGAFNATNGTQSGADGRIDKNLDYAAIGKSIRSYGFTTNLGMKYQSVFLRTQIGTSWGGSRSIDVVDQYTSTNDAFWSRESFWTDMYGFDNLNGKYPNLAHRDNLSPPSDFWQINTFRCNVRNLTVGFDFPQEFLSQLKISKASLGVTGNNLWDLYNPFPDKYRNMYDNSLSGYPTLRSWTVNLNISF
ncbi:SusC/RagA family TonB-linked outer membrane protein [Flavobacterium cellulosilyticum]|uniref:SusC/RagA family TonB-linked outer membrane protein n=1 Tax=Flavobacterium cellulosilyticum TaxID=2541731 RepID=A0A4V6PFA8_9FLAO|nr:SusC/RagA family TonB-linked outer membrane protein [Flavobacterium cellulosilyticum]TDD97807.1 SusC/RagA family TonB-linked outer membrane protein [Flavobacterium cellulosilyticum]